MYMTEEILGKLNAGNSKLQSASDQKITLPDIMVRSFAQVKELAGDTLSWGEKNFLYQEAQAQLKENKMAESRILSRANPQLANAVRLGIRQSSMLGSYDDLFPSRSDNFVKPGSVASMFSPAGYLTELYREARDLHPETSQYHLDTRRPDLASLSLSQSNMDDELSTLSLSNELLLNNIQQHDSLTYDGVLEMLASYRQTGATPYSQPYETVRQAILLKDPAFAAFRNNPTVAAKMDTSGLLGVTSDVSPELHDILTEEITEANADALIKKNFGDIGLNAFNNVAYLARWYGLTYDEMNSLLQILSESNEAVLGMQYYYNDQLISFVVSDNHIDTSLITRRVDQNDNKLIYAELIPVTKGYIFSFSMENKLEEYSRFEIKDGDDVTYEYLDENFIPEANQSYQIHLENLDPKKLTADGGLSLRVNRWNSAEAKGYTSIFNFQQKTYPFNIFLLKINKLIRLYKATSIILSDIRTVIESVNNDLTITAAVLSRLFWVNYYSQHYGLNFSAALVLAGANISQIAHSGKDSAFTRLFNTPPLNNQLFYADGTVLDLEPGKSAETFRLGALKRALQVDDTGLYTLYTLTFTDKDSQGNTIDFTTTIDNLSALYRTRLLADVNQLTVTELSLLLSVSPYASLKLDTLTEDKLSSLASSIGRYSQWLKEMNWTVSDLYLMLTDTYSTVLSPDIENLIATLKNGLSNLDLSGEDVDPITAAAPFIAAATQLDSAETAVAILQWLDQLKPQELTVKDFLGLVDNDSRTDNQTFQLVSFCQVMGQLALIVRNTGLSASELSWGVAHPVIFVEKSKVLGQDIDTLRDLTQLHALLGRSGTYASEILTSLSGKASSKKSNLAVDTLATALALDPQALKQALKQVSAYEYFYSWIYLRDALQWLDVATTFGITPDDVAKMVALKYSGTDASPYKDWVIVSHALQAGLNAQQTAQLQASLDEALSAALSAYVVSNIAPSDVTDRDKLYSWLLIDNQVSAQVKTTRIAEAIASVQLYVNRALMGQEAGVDNAAKSKAFFTSDWDVYNKRYSTWAGVSELVYYPENYVDPTLRLGQTGMMNEMLQTLSQSQLTSDTVEDAFKTYMTRFEEIANLDIVSGYHDNLNDQKGVTYLIGRSAAGDYYWRSADISKLSDGKLPANAWAEWKKIATALTPVNNLVRPVIFQSRLYVTWVESREVGISDDKESKILEYALKYAHILHDGTWSAPVSVTLENGTLPLESVAIDVTGMYCAKDAQHDQLYILFYEKKETYDDVNDILTGIILHDDGTTTTTSGTSVSGLVVYKQLDTTKEVRLNTPYPGGKTYYSVNNMRESSQWGIDNISRLSGCSVTDFVFTEDGGKLNVAFNATERIIYRGNPDDQDRVDLVNMIKAIGNIGDIFKIPLLNSNSEGIEKPFTCIFRQPDEKTAAIAYFSDAQGLSIDHFAFNDESEKMLSSILTPEEKDFYKLERVNNDLKIYKDSSNTIKPDNFVYFGEGIDLPSIKGMVVEVMFGAFGELKTGIKDESVKLSVSAGVINNSPVAKKTKYTFDESLYVFEGQTLSIQLSEFEENNIDLNFTFLASETSGGSLGKSVISARLTRTSENTIPVISLNKTADNAQYLQYGIHRIRVNTLFAKQLVARANAGLDTVLSMVTQQLKEPKMGKGAYIDLELNASSDGNSSVFEVLMCDVFTKDDRIALTSGTLSSTGSTSCSFFIPRLDESTESSVNMYFCVKVHDAESRKVKITGSEGAWRYEFVDGTTTTDTYIANIYVRNDTTEPMDFNGANALYFWEMFYYVPMMVFKRLFSESRFAEATQWVKYIWSPDGYLVDGQPATYTWNVRPLEEETAWHANPLDSVDPDAVAQADPLHYKIATFMAYLDLLIARGDAAFRQLERDTLNEAKMWYVQALDILGDEPFLAQNSGWASPRLSDAADKTTQKDVQQALMAVRQPITAGDLRTANSLTGLFLPQQNAKLQGYWQTLAQRLYNLRHNLSIDGSPLSLAIYATPADPAALLSAAVNSASGGSDLPAAVMPLYRFPVILESARGMVGQLTQFGGTLLSITERQDAEALSELLQTQGSALVLQSIALQNSAVAEIDADKTALEASLSGAQSRLASYTTLYDENVNAGESQAMDLYLSASVISTTAAALHMAAAALDVVPNIYGMAVGGGRYGALFNAGAIGAQIGGDVSRIAADRISQSEAYRRRRQEWEIQRNAAQADVKQIEAQLASLAVRRESAVLQKTYLETQQGQMQAQMTFLQNKFTSKALYNWLRGKLAAIYYQFYDLTVSRCLMAEAAYSWEFKGTQETGAFIRPGAWQGTYAGLMAGETLMLNLAQMENSYLAKDERQKQVTRTVCLSEFYAGLSSDSFALADAVTTLVTDGQGKSGSDDNGVTIDGNQLQATLKLSDLNIGDDYPESLGTTRRVKQISVTLPALVGPYQDVRAVLSYSGSVDLPKGCKAAAVSHGMNDSGQFQLDFNDSCWLPFEGIPVGDSGTLTLSFPDATHKQKDLLLSLADIILHIRYTIAS